MINASKIKKEEVTIQQPDSDIINLSLNCNKMFDHSEIYNIEVYIIIIQPQFLEYFIASNYRREFSDSFQDKIKFNKIDDAKYRIEFNGNWKVQLDRYFQTFHH